VIRVDVDAVTAVDEAEALARRPLDELMAAAAARRDRRWGRVSRTPSALVPASWRSGAMTIG
jgi:hypothetical protein